MKENSRKLATLIRSQLTKLQANIYNDQSRLAAAE